MKGEGNCKGFVKRIGKAYGCLKGGGERKSEDVACLKE